MACFKVPFCRQTCIGNSETKVVEPCLIVLLSSSLYSLCFLAAHLVLVFSFGIICVWGSLAVLDSQHRKPSGRREVARGVPPGFLILPCSLFFRSVYWRLEDLLINSVGNTRASSHITIYWKDKIKIQSEIWMLEWKPVWFNQTQTNIKALYWGWK